MKAGSSCNPHQKRYTMTLDEQYEHMRKQRGPDYKPRTRHLGPDGWAKYTNRLFLETSPYLLQHAHNPVDWHPWGDEAFELARERDCPVLLSVGYSTCHGCHVMEEASFEDEEIAGFINQNYVAVKVDREERPDVDAVYMTADDHETLIAREKPSIDGALPSGNAVAVLNLLRMGALTADISYSHRAQKALAAFSKSMTANPTAFAGLMVALDFLHSQSREIIIVTPGNDPALAEPLLEPLRSNFLPNKALVVVGENHIRQDLEDILPLVRKRRTQDNKTTAYVCQNHTCRMPTTDPHEFARILGL